MAHNWLHPFGNAGSFGPYYTLATSVGLGWLGTVLIIDALISPGGTGLVYLASTSRLSYSLARVRFLPPVFASIDRRGIKISHHLPFWWDIGAIAVFSLIVFYYAVNSRLGPERVNANVLEAVADAHQEDLDLGIAEPA